MKYVIILLGSLLTGLFGWLAPQAPSPKPKPMTVCGMAEFVDDPAFAAAHPYVALQQVSLQGDMVKIEVPNGEPANAYLLKSSKPSQKFLMVIHEWYGLNDNVKMEADKMFSDLKDVNVMALDMYDGKVATTPDKAGEYMKGLDQNRAEEIVKAAFSYMGEKAQVATIGWCFGGGWSLKSALLGGEQVVGCVIYYGMPVQDIAQLETLNTDVLGIFAKKDRWITPEVVATFQTNMAKAGKKVSVHSYDADHAFANPSGPRYNEAAAKEAYGLTLAYLKEHW